MSEVLWTPTCMSVIPSFTTSRIWSSISTASSETAKETEFVLASIFFFSYRTSWKIQSEDQQKHVRPLEILLVGLHNLVLESISAINAFITVFANVNVSASYFESCLANSSAYVLNSDAVPDWLHTFWFFEIISRSGGPDWCVEQDRNDLTWSGWFLAGYLVSVSEYF